MKRLNVKLAAWLVGTTLVLVVGVHLLHGFQLDRNAESLKRMAEQAKESGDSKEAIKQYNQYLKYRDDPEGYSALADLVVETTDDASATRQDWNRAYVILEEAIRRHPDLKNVRRQLVDYTMRGRRFNEATEHIQYLKEQGETDPELDFKAAQCSLYSGADKDAVKKLSELVGYDYATDQFKPGTSSGAKEVQAYDLLAQLLQREPDGLKRAEGVMKQLIALNPESADAYLAEVKRIYAEADKLRARLQPGDADGMAKYMALVDNATPSVEKAFEVGPDDADVLLAVAFHAMVQQQYPKADKVLKTALEKYPDRQDVYIRLAQLMPMQGQPNKSAEYLRQGVEKSKDVQMILPMLFDIQFQAQDLAGAKETARLMEEKGTFSKEYVRFCRACVDFAQGNHWEASREFESVRPALARSAFAVQVERLDVLLSQCYESLGLYDRQLEVARRVIQANPGQAGARLREAFALQALGRYDEAETSLELLLANVEEYPALKAPVLQLLTVDQLHRPADERDWSKVEKLAEAIYADPARSPVDNAVLKAELLIAQERLEDAQAALIAARKQDPKDVRVWTGLIKLMLRNNKPENVSRLLDLADKEVGPSVPLQAERIRMIGREGGDDAVGKLEAIEKEVEKQPDAERRALIGQLGTAYLQMRNYEGTKRCWNYLISKDETNAQLRQLLFELMSDNKDEEGMQAMLKSVGEAKNFGTNSSLYKYLQGMLMVRPIVARVAGKPGALTDDETKTLSEARRIIVEAISVRPEWSVLHRVRAEIDQLEGSIDSAITNYQRALDSSHTGQTAVARRLVALLCQQRRFAEADKVLKYAGAASATDPLHRLTQQIKVETGDVGEALAMAEKDVEEDPKNPAGYIWYGQLLDQAGGRNDEAGAAYRKAVELGPELPQAWELLIRHLMANKKKAEAVEVVREATEKLPKNPVALGVFNELIGDQAQAESLYKAAVAEKPDDTTAQRRMVEYYFKSAQAGPQAQFSQRIAQAAPYLERIVQKTSGSNDAAAQRELAWARRTQAEVLAASGSYGDLVKAVKLIEQNGSGDKLAQEDIVAIVNLLSKRFEPESRAKATKLLKQLQELRPKGLFPREQLLLGQLYESAGDWPNAKEQMVGSLDKQAKDPEALSAFIQSLIRHEEYKDAGIWLDKLDELLANAQPRVRDALSPAARESRAQALVGDGQLEQAVATLMKLVPSPLPPNQLYRLEQVSRMFENLANIKRDKEPLSDEEKKTLADVSRKLLDEFVQQEPRGTIALAAYLGRRGELDEAMKLLDESRTNQSVTEVLPVALEALRRNPEKSTPEYLKKLESWGQAALQAEPNAVQIKLLLAELYDLQGQYAEVKKIYRDVLSSKSITPVQSAIVKNNLAFILALNREESAEAIQMIDEAIQIVGPTSDLLDTRGLTYLAAGKANDGVKILKQAVSEVNPAPTKYFHLALAHQAANDVDAAREALATADSKGLDPKRLTPLERKSYNQLIEDLK